MRGIIGFKFIPEHDQDQALRLRRMLIGTFSYLFTFAVVVACWQMNYFDGRVVLLYLAIIASVNLSFYLIIRSGLNLRFADPSLTLIQMTVSIPTLLYVMYYANEVRSALLYFSMSLLMFGLFQFRLRNFIAVTVLLLGGYAVLIWLLVVQRPQEIHLQVEIIQWIALAAMLLQSSALGSYIGRLRHKVKEKNLELAKHNVALEKALRRNEELAIRDELTGAYNRRYLMEIIAMEKLRCDRSGSIFSLCIIDVDFFKSVNDTYGHLAGDEVLCAIAKTIAEGMRQTDYFGRYGGEEFAMVLTNTLEEGALISAERVRFRIQNLRFPDINADLKVTISIGIAQLQKDEASAATFKRADGALYRAKNGGRNQSVAAGLA